MIMVATMKPAMALLFLLLIQTTLMITSFGNENPRLLCHESERQALLNFKQDFKDPSNRLSSWIAEKDCCKWSGIVCHNVTGHVEELHLGYTFFDDDALYYNPQRYQLRGEMNSALLNLKHLTHIDLSYNNFGGIQIPTFFGSLRSLRYLNLSGAGFVGRIPPQLGNLSSLRSLDLGGCLLFSNNMKWLQGLSSLENLDMSGVDLSKASDHWLQVLNNLPSLLELHMSNCKLNRIPSPTFVNFTSLNVLDFSNNNFESSLIPQWIFSFRSLETLDLFWNDLQGELSSDIENLTSLLHLHLSGNQLRGHIPRSMGNLCQLREIDLGYNNFEGEISKIFESFSSCNSSGLELLFLGNNNLSGPMPVGYHFEQFLSLSSLDFSYNSISGLIPKSIAKISSLMALDISYNEFNGTLPQNIGGLSNLQQLCIDGNRLEGVVSEAHFANLTELTSFSASGNSLTLKVSPHWIPPFQLQYLKLSSWKLGFQFPMWIRSQKHMESLILSNTQISDIIPSWILNFSSNLSHLNLSHNQIHGQIPKIHSLHGDPLIISLSSNQLSGPLSYLPSNILILDLSNNQFSGEISHFLCRSEQSLEILILRTNHLFGKIPNCWKNWPMLQFINLGSNNFTGKIPSSMGDLPNLRSLHLRNNSLFGELPHSLHKCTYLQTLDVGMNKITGSIPLWMGTSLSDLMYLVLRSNQFTGQIPEELCQLSYLQIMDVADNHLLGNIPKCFNSFGTLAKQRNYYELISYEASDYGYLENANIVIKGTEFEFDTILKFVTSLDLSSNNISGEIPEELTSLWGLLSLNLSNNNLTGAIPHKIGDMKLLESLDLSTNHLFGQIPPSMSSLNFLSHLNLSNNILSGQIPLVTQLQSLNASCFTGNKLCGPPLTKNCSSKEITPTAAHWHTEEKEVDWLFLFVALGFAVGFGGVWLPLYCSKAWRCTYFAFIDSMLIKIWVFFRGSWFR